MQKKPGAAEPLDASAAQAPYRGHRPGLERSCHALYGRVMKANPASIMPQVIAV